jgi:uncharacterized protein (TIGR04255 family)
VAEVVLGVQFDDVIGLRHIDLGALAEVYRESLPVVSEQQPLSPEFEMFGLAGPQAAPSLRVTFGPPLPRLWFENREKTELVQIQSNRFIFNWRQAESSVYPRYEHLAERFRSQFSKFRAFVEGHKLAELILNQCEVTYVNIIPVRDDELDPAQRIFRFWRHVASDRLSELEDASFQIRFVFRDADGKPFSRLTAHAFPGVDQRQSKVYQFGLTVRGKPSGPAADSVFDFFDFARDKIVCGFKDLTTPEMHAEWRISDDG